MTLLEPGLFVQTFGIVGFNVFFDLTGVEKFISLESLSVQRYLFSDLSGLQSLNSLTELNFDYCDVTDLTPISQFGKPEIFIFSGLTNNCVDDTPFIEGGVTYNNINILANLNSKNTSIIEANRGALTKLYLAGNDGIINFEPLTGLTWGDKSGF